MDVRWSLTITGYNEVFEHGVPVSNFKYEVYFSFDDLKSTLDFVSKFQENAVENHKYYIQAY